MIVELTAAAEAELESIGDYIARDNPERALSFVRELARSCLDLADMPEAWPVVPRYKHLGIRRRVHGRYLIFYRIGADRITVLNVLNGAMDVEAVLFPYES
ncbi:MAG: type II toxin-antitoxin system RelE/ParE family toxin [Rhodobacteraceae bacterium]|nr:type II toxin-antitoxin system RelE/ParE family toxin [Paracoccaceae bacterium]